MNLGSVETFEFIFKTFIVVSEFIMLAMFQPYWILFISLARQNLDIETENLDG